MKNSNLLIGLFVFVFSLLLTDTSFAQKHNEIYYLKTTHGHYLSIDNNSKSNNAKIKASKLSKIKAQKFRLLNAGSGYFYIQNINSKKYITVPSGSKKDCLDVVQFSKRNGAKSQIFKFSRVNEFVRIQNINSWKYLTFNGLKLQQGCLTVPFGFFELIPEGINYNSPIARLKGPKKHYVPSVIKWYGKAMGAIKGTRKQALSTGNIKQVTVEVDFKEMVIKNNPDNLSSGDYYWNFDVNGDRLVTQANAITLSKGKRVSITGDTGARSKVVLPSNGEVELSGHVMDKDGAFNGSDDDCGAFFINIPVWKIPTNRSWLTVDRFFRGVEDSGQTIVARVRRIN